MLEITLKFLMREKNKERQIRKYEKRLQNLEDQQKHNEKVRQHHSHTNQMKR